MERLVETDTFMQQLHMEKLLRSASDSTPDAERAYKNLDSFCKENPEHTEELRANISSVAMLFSYSQFLASFCIANPEILFSTLKILDSNVTRENLSASLREQYLSNDDHMKVVRRFKKKEILRIALKDILKKSDLTEVMHELSILADVIVGESLVPIKKRLNETYGEPGKNTFTIISLGKLGGEELNFSSDIDVIFLYESDEGETSGITTPHGLTTNRITSHEYYCKLGEALTRFLSLNTEDSFAYRVDLRLRPEGQRGSIALSLPAYENYYESWGRTWERAVLLRARTIAGDFLLGNKFLAMITPFVYRKYLDFSALEEIKQVKTRIDSAFKKDDIKRGYGGIREIEFFVHALQLIYGGKEPLLRERMTQKALHKLLQKSLIGHDDYLILLNNYRFLRTLEHRLQMLNDLQTHSLPSSENELSALSRKMGFKDKEPFLKDLESKRRKVRSIYDSFFKEEKKVHAEGEILFDEELSETELKEQLKKIGLKDINRGMRNIQNIRDSVYLFQTIKGRRLLSEILPVFVDSAIKSSNPDMALNHLEPFSFLLSTNESYLELFKENKDLIPILINLFSQSEYLSKLVIRRPDYLELIGHELGLRKTVRRLKNELKEDIKGGQSISDAIRGMKHIEELRLSLLFLQKSINVTELVKFLSKTAEAVLAVTMEELGSGLAIIGFGKLGGRELTFNSDLDIIFVLQGQVTLEHTKIAERLLRILASYTREGIAYRADTRLRPDGTKGPLVTDVNSFIEYYSKSAGFWEYQALLKARPVGGDVKTGNEFIRTAKNILIEHGSNVSASDIRAMRERIQKELARESDSSYNIKLGYGGLEELEFTVQYLQLVNCRRYPFLLVQGTLDAIRRLENTHTIKKQDAGFMYEAYIFYRTLESYLRLREKDIFKNDDDMLLNAASEFLGLKDKNNFIERLEEIRKGVRDIYERFLL